MATSDTREKLLHAAEQQVRRKGVDGFSYSNLSAEVGIRKASIHYHFPAKSDLLTALMAQYAKQVLLQLEGYVEDMERPDQQLRAFVGLYRAALQEGASLCLCIAFIVSRDGLAPETRQEISRYRRAVEHWLRLRFEQAQTDQSLPARFGTPRYEAAAALALVEGAQLSARMTGDPTLFDIATQAFCDRLC
jgi:TetR/AcrR family transcriptional regulator, transcriptional repressor for nem operon